MQHCAREGRQETLLTDLCLVHVHSVTWTVTMPAIVLSLLTCEEEGGDAGGRGLNLLVDEQHRHPGLQHLRQPQIGGLGEQGGEDGAGLRGSAMRKSGP